MPSVVRHTPHAKVPAAKNAEETKSEPAVDKTEEPAPRRRRVKKDAD